MRAWLLLSLNLLGSSAHAGWHDRKAEGWAFYEDRPLEMECPEQNEIPAQTLEMKSPSERLEECKKILQNSLALAVLEPTEENIYAYIREQEKWISRGGEFAAEWMRIILKNPGLNPNGSYSTSQYGRKIERQMKVQAKERHIRDLGKEYGLFVFYEGASPKSQAFAPIISFFALEYDWSIIPVTLDGVVIESLKNTQVDEGIASRLGVEQTPAVLALNPNTGDARPLGIGLMSLDQIESNIITAFGEVQCVE